MDIQTHKLFVLVTDEKFSLSERINAPFYLQRRIRNLLKLKFDKNTNEFDYTIESILNDQWDIEKDLLNKIGSSSMSADLEKNDLINLANSANSLRKNNIKLANKLGIYIREENSLIKLL